MSIVDRSRAVESSVRARLSVTVRWSVSAEALRRAQGPLTPRVHAWLASLPRAHDEVIAAWRVDVDDASRDADGCVRAFDASARLEAPAAVLELFNADPANARLTIVHDADLTHLHLAPTDEDSRADGTTLLSATIRSRTGGESQCVYAASALLATLGLAGGRYEVAGASLACDGRGG